MQDFATAAALVLVIEGMLWSLFPETMKRAAARTLILHSSTLRGFGIVLAVFGVAVVWLIRRG